MGSIVRNGSSWRASVRINCPVTGKRITKTKQGPKKGALSAWMTETEAAIRRGEFSGGKTIRTVAELFNAYRTAELDGSAKWHARAGSRYLGFWEDHLGPQTAIQAVTPDAIQDGLNLLAEGKGPGCRKPLAESTRRSWYHPLSRAFNLAKEWGWMSDIPSARVKRPAKAEPRKRFLRKEEIPHLMAACRKADASGRSPLRLEAFVEAALLTAVRKQALLDLTWRNVHLGHDIIIVTDKGKTRPVPLVGKALERIREAAKEDHGPDDFVFGSNKLHHSTWVRVRNSAGLPDVTIHDLRRTFGSHFVMETGDLRTAQALLGHSRIDQTAETYSHLLFSHLADSAKRIEAIV